MANELNRALKIIDELADEKLSKAEAVDLLHLFNGSGFASGSDEDNGVAFLQELGELFRRRVRANAERAQKLLSAVDVETAGEVAESQLPAKLPKKSKG